MNADRSISLFTQSLFALPLDDALDAAAAIGVPAVELACTAPHLDRTTAERRAAGVARGMRDRGLATSALSLFTHLTDPDTVRRHIDDALFFIRLAPVFETAIVKVTPGPPASAAATPEHWRCLERAMAQLIEAAEDMGVRLAFETHMRQLTDTLAGTQRLLGLADAACVGVTLDFSNMVFARESIEECIRTLAPRIYNCHVKNGCIADDGSWHFGPLNEGWTRYDHVMRLLEEIRYNGYLTVECLGEEAQRAPRQTAARDIAILRELLEDTHAAR